MTRPYRNLGFFFLALFILVLAGFTPRLPGTPFFGYFSSAPRFENVPTIVHFHALTCMAWFAVLIVQPFLVGANRLCAHRWLGWASVVLVMLFVASVTGLLAQRHAVYQLALDPAFFVLFYALALLLRRRFFAHVAFVFAAALMIAQPGLARLGIYLAGGFPGVLWTMAVLYALIAGFWLHAKFACGRPLLKSPCLVILPLFVLDHVLTLALA